MLLDSVSNFLLEILHLRLNVRLACNFIFTVFGLFSYQDYIGLEWTGEYFLFFFPLKGFVYYWNYLLLESLIRT